MKLIRFTPLYLAFSLITFVIGVASVWFLTGSEAEVSPALPTQVSPESSDSGSGMGGMAVCYGSKWISDEGRGLDAVESKSKTKSLRIISTVKATYTDEARQNGIEGSVLVKVTLLANGKVGNVSVVRGLPDGLNEKAVEAARQIRFEPKKVDGRPVSATKTLEYTFTIY